MWLAMPGGKSLPQLHHSLRLRREAMSSQPSPPSRLHTSLQERRAALPPSARAPGDEAHARPRRTSLSTAYVATARRRRLLVCGC